MSYQLVKMPRKWLLLMHSTDLRKISDLRQLGSVFGHVAQKLGQALFYDGKEGRFLRSMATPAR